MDIVTLSPVDSALLPDTTSVDILPPSPLDSALQPPDWGMPLPDMASNTFNPVSGWDMPSLDTTLDIGQVPTDWANPVTDWAQPQPEWVLPTTEFSHQPSDWTQPVTPVPEHHAPSAMPRSASAAETAAGWADWHQANADKAKEWAVWDAEHNPDNLAHHVKEAEEEQAKADEKRQEALNELNKSN